MYARYIPPPKGSKPSPASPPVPPHIEAPPPIAPAPSPVVSSATPYSRYVPPVRIARHPATPTPTPRAPPPSKTHLNAAAIPPPEALPAKIVFNYDEDEPSPPKKRKIEAVESVAESKSHKEEDAQSETPKKSKKDKKVKKDKEKSGEERKKKKDKHSKGQKDDQVSEDQKDKNKSNKNEKGEQQPFAFGFDKDVTAPDTEEPNFEVLPANDHTADTKREMQTKESKTKKERRSEDSEDTSKRHKSVLEKAAKSIKEGSQRKDEQLTGEDEDEAEPVEAHGLEPLPQPELVNLDGPAPTYETLPTWIANPIRVTPETKASFQELGVGKEAATRLGSKGYENAFAVQTAVIPLLMPSLNRQSDVVVSAATGSGKTLAYVLPMVSDISQGVVTRLRGVIVVPTRELVLQAKEVCEASATAFSGPGKKTVKVGISMGNKQFEQEQADLVEEEQRFDPNGYDKWLREHFEQDLEASLFDESPRPLPGHVVDYHSKVDILICTPGRLVDHINRTKGFTLDFVRWLVVDEADKLLAQTFQDWLPVVMPLLSATTQTGARDFPDSNKSGVRKVILSATMTRDIGLLNGLKLSRPTLVTLEGVNEDKGQARQSKTEHVLPELLEESAVKTRDPNLKPLYLLDLLNGNHMNAMDDMSNDVQMKDASDDDTSSSESESDSETSDSDTSNSEESESESEESYASKDLSSRKRKLSSPQLKETSFNTTVLIFTKSNETAIRLSRLLSLLSPKLSTLIGTLTSTTRTSQRRKTLRAFTTGKLRILVASDLVARGIDLANLDHVVNYDMPTSVASYVHRVGRTARAGRKGHAWTLFTKTEAGWFWTAIAGKGESKSQGAASAGTIKRRGKIGEVKVNDRWEEAKVAEFEGALEKLGKEASEMRRKK